MYNKVVLSVVQNVLHVGNVALHGRRDFKSLGASDAEINWLMFETEQRLKVELPEHAITPESTIRDLVRTVVVHR